MAVGLAVNNASSGVWRVLRAWKRALLALRPEGRRSVDANAYLRDNPDCSKRAQTRLNTTTNTAETRVAPRP